MSLHKLFDLSQRTVLITGGSRGIGKAVARGCAEAGASTILICSRHEAELQQAAGEIAAGLPTRVHTRVVDMTDRAQVRSLADWALATAGQVDILVNNAGNNRPQNLVDTTEEAWDNILELNVTSCMLLAKHLAPRMIERGWGRIIYLSSIMALASKTGRGCYSATKAALVGMARAQALELGPHGITVNCLAPGPVLTDLPKSLLSAEQQRVIAERTAVKRWAEPEDMVGPTLMLASNAGAYVTGYVMLADGGILARTFD